MADHDRGGTNDLLYRSDVPSPVRVWKENHLAAYVISVVKAKQEIRLAIVDELSERGTKLELSLEPPSAGLCTGSL